MLLAALFLFIKRGILLVVVSRPLPTSATWAWRWGTAVTVRAKAGARRQTEGPWRDSKDTMLMAGLMRISKGFSVGGCEGDVV